MLTRKSDIATMSPSNGMTKRLAESRRDNLIKVELAKGAFLLLTWSEYSVALQRGKAARRALRMSQSAKSRREEQTVERKIGEIEFQDKKKLADLVNQRAF